MDHASDCAVHNEPAYPAGPCNCGADRDWRMRHGLIGEFLDWLTRGAFAKYVQRDPRPYGPHSRA